MNKMAMNSLEGVGTTAPPVVQPKQVDVAAAPRVAAERAEKPKAVKDDVKISAASGNVRDYTVNSENELVIKVKDGQTEMEIRQIPSKESQAARHAFREVVDKLFDETV